MQKKQKSLPLKINSLSNLNNKLSFNLGFASKRFISLRFLIFDMKILIFTVIALFSAISISNAQNVTVNGTVSDSLTGNKLSGAIVAVGTTKGICDANGSFSISVSPSEYEITVIAEGFKYFRTKVEVNSDITLNFTMLPVFSLENESDISEVELSDDDFSSSSGGQNVSPLLSSSADAFSQAASFTFSTAGFRARGYDSQYNDVFMNGIPLYNPENGRPVWSEWGGLNDALRFKETTTGLTPSPYSIGSIGGTTAFNTRATAIRAQNKISYAISNRSYDNRIMYTYATGLMENDWAFAISASKRWAGEGFVEGTFYDAYSYFISAEKKLNENHHLGFTIMAAPYTRGMQAAATQEAYDLAGTNYYNPNWGYQNGEKRNARVRTMHQPRFMATHHWKINDKSSLLTTFSYVMGNYSNTYLNWYNASDPRPDYYRKLPSWFSLESNNTANYDIYDDYTYQQATYAWQNDDNTRQLNWDRLYQVNLLANLEGKQANYIIEKRIDATSREDFASVYNNQITENISISAGLQAHHSNTNHFKVLDDLLGGTYWVDIDQFAERDFSGDTIILQNDLENPDAVIKEGDVFGYDYDIVINDINLWGLTRISLNKIEGFAGVNLQYNSFYREGHMKNGRYPDNSLGKSEVSSFTGYGIKAGLTYKISGRNYIMAQGGYFVKPPSVYNSYPLQKICNKTIDGIKNESIASADLSYIHRGIFWNARLTAYQTWLNDQSSIRSFYHDELATFVNLIMTNVDKIHQGIEAGIDVKLTKTISLIGASAIGNFLYTSRPNATISTENGSVPDTMQVIYMKYFFVSGTPQMANTIGIKYAHPKFWFFEIKFNYFDRMYLDINPIRRTEEATMNIGEGDPLIDEITEQTKLPSGYTIDMSLGKSWRIKNPRTMYIALNLNASNLLDNTNLITGGFEASRFDLEGKDINKFQNQYYYAYGRTYFLMLSLRF